MFAPVKLTVSDLAMKSSANVFKLMAELPLSLSVPFGITTKSDPVTELVYAVFVLVPVNAAVTIAVSDVIAVIDLVSLPEPVVVVIESPTLKVFVKTVDVPVTAVPVTDTVPGLYT